jgi:Fic family protein
MDWDKFSFEFSFNASQELVTDIIQIEAYKEAALNLIMPPDWGAQLDRLNRIRAVHGTTALEGNPLSEAEVSQQLDLLSKPPSRVPASATKEQLQIRNAGRAQTWVRLRFTPENAPMRVEDILHLHQMITEESDEGHNQPGRFRTYPVVVGTPSLGGVHKGAPAEALEQLMEQYIEFLQHRKVTSQHPVIRALLAHFFLITIHPFGDGNGRVSRLVEAGILYQGGYNVLGFYGLSNYFYRNGDEYKTTLQGCRDKQPFDVTRFIKFGLTGFGSELKGINNFIKAKLNRVVYRATLVRAFNKKTSDRRRALNQREYSLLDFLLTETEPIDPFSERPTREIKISELRLSPFIQASYRSVSPRTFTRELLRLSELGFITFKSGDGTDDGPVVEIDFGAIGKY